MNNRLFSNPLIEVNPLELCKLWGELVEAYHGVNGFGGYTAEIYAYRFMAYVPAAHSHIGHESEPARKARDEVYYKAANQLVALIEEFIDWYDCYIQINGLAYQDWHRGIVAGQGKFDHRVRVTVERKDGE